MGFAFRRLIKTLPFFFLFLPTPSLFYSFLLFEADAHFCLSLSCFMQKQGKVPLQARPKKRDAFLSSSRHQFFLKRTKEGEMREGPIKKVGEGGLATMCPAKKKKQPNRSSRYHTNLPLLPFVSLAAAAAFSVPSLSHRRIISHTRLVSLTQGASRDVRAAKKNQLLINDPLFFFARDPLFN